MLTHVQTKVFPFLKDLNGDEASFTHHMKNAVFIIPKPSLLVEAVKIIDEIFEEMEKGSEEKGQAFQDIQGDVYRIPSFRNRNSRQERTVPDTSSYYQAHARAGATKIW